MTSTGPRPAAGCATAISRIYLLLRREGWRVNHKRVYRRYRGEGLSPRLKRPRRHVSAAHRERQPAALQPNERWPRDFVSDALFDGADCEPERWLMASRVRLRPSRWIKALRASRSWLSLPAWLSCAEHRAVQVGNGPEFVSKALDRWAYENGVTLDSSRPGNPIHEAPVESFNGRLRHACLNTDWFSSLADAESKIETWRQQYNESLPHTALGWLTPQEFALAADQQAAE